MVDPLEMFVAIFRDAFDASKEPELWQNLVREEEAEVAEAAANLIKEIVDLAWVTEGFRQVGGEPGDLVGRLPEWIGDVVEAIPQDVLAIALTRVYESNMSKLGEDGKPIRREDGKVLKGPNYQPADLKDLTFIQ